MNWKDIQEELLKEINPEQDKWIRKNVALDAGDLRKMTTGEVRSIFPGKTEYEEDEAFSTVDDSRLIRTFIWQSYLFIKASEIDPLKGNIRSFWYQHLGPFMKNHNLLESDEVPVLYRTEGVFSITMAYLKALYEADERIEGEYRLYDRAIRAGGGRESYLTNKMYNCFDDFVLMGFFRFQDEFEFKDIREYFRIVGKKRPRLIFFTEKEGLFWLCKEFSQKYGISTMASHGEPGYLTMEYFACGLKAKDVKNIEVAALTDYDPWGYNIAREFERKLRIFGFNVNTTFLTSLKLFTEESIDFKKRDLTKVSPSKQKQVDDWMKITGGINGEPYGMHVDNGEVAKIKRAVARWYKEVT